MLWVACPSRPVPIADGKRRMFPPISATFGGPVAGSFYGHRDWLQKRPVSDRLPVIVTSGRASSKLSAGRRTAFGNRDGVRSTTRPDLRPVRSCRRADVSERADGRVRPTGSRHWARLNEDDQFLAVGCRRDPMLRKNDGGLLCFRSAVAISLSFSRLSKRLHRRPLYLRGKV